MVDISKFNFKTEEWSERLFEPDVYIDKNEPPQRPLNQEAKLCGECGLLCEVHSQFQKNSEQDFSSRKNHK